MGRRTRRASTADALGTPETVNPSARRTSRAAELVAAVVAHTAVAPATSAIATTSAMTARPTPRPRAVRVGQSPASRRPASSVFFNRAEPTTWSSTTTAQVTSLIGPSIPARRSRWNARSQSRRASDQASSRGHPRGDLIGRGIAQRRGDQFPEHPVVNSDQRDRGSVHLRTYPPRPEPSSRRNSSDTRRRSCS